jgi:hypothetical protein
MRETPGQTAAATVLADIEATVDGRCACGCGVQLGPNSNSMWFADNECQELWHARRTSNQFVSPRTRYTDLRLRTSRAWARLGRNRAVITAWLAANNIDPAIAPTDNTIEVRNGELHVDVWRTDDGKPVVVDDEMLCDRVVVPQLVPLDTTQLTDEPLPPPDEIPETQPEPTSTSTVQCLHHRTGERLIVPKVPGTYRIVLHGMPLADVIVPPRPPWWRRIWTRQQPQTALTVDSIDSGFRTELFGEPAPQPWWCRVLRRPGRP